MHRTRRIRLCGLVALGLTLGLGSGIGAAFAQDKTFELKLSHWVPPSHPLQKAMEEWGASIEQDSGGTIKYKVYPAQQLGKAFDHYDMARDGIADVTYVSPGYQPGRFPDLRRRQSAVHDGERQRRHRGARRLVPQIRRDRDEGRQVSASPSPTIPAVSIPAPRKSWCPADIKDMKIRPAHATIASLVTSLGGTNVQAAAPEVRDILEKGVADAVTFPWGSVMLFGIDKVTKYHMEAALYTTGFVWVMNKDTYAAMSPSQQKVIDNHCNQGMGGEDRCAVGRFRA